jgi:hypothetical protein
LPPVFVDVVAVEVLARGWSTCINEDESNMKGFAVCDEEKREDVDGVGGSADQSISLSQWVPVDIAASVYVNQYDK